MNVEVSVSVDLSTIVVLIFQGVVLEEGRLTFKAQKFFQTDFFSAGIVVNAI